MTQDSRWPQDYDALIGRLPRIVEQSRLTLGGFSACVDVYLSLREAFGALHAATPGRPQGIAMLEELMRRAASGIGGELFIDWADGPSWIERHVIGRRAIGGTSAQAAFMLAELGAAALIALQDRSAGQLAALHPATLLAIERGLAPARTVAPQGGERPAHYIFEFTAGETIGDIRVARSSRTIVRFGHEALQRDAFFEQTSVEQAPHAGAGILCGFNEVAPGSLGAELDYAARLAGAWREAGLAFIHLELGDFSDLSARDESLRRLLPAK
jgi:ADP-dependent phosphofructokinase/glucokinase